MSRVAYFSHSKAKGRDPEGPQPGRCYRLLSSSPRSVARAASGVSQTGPAVPQTKQCARCPPRIGLTNTGVFPWSQRRGCFLPRACAVIYDLLLRATISFQPILTRLV